MTFPAFLIPIIIAAIIILYIVIHYERKTMERADRNLKKEHELLRITLSSIRDGVIAANEKGEIIFMNYPAEVLTGISEKESVNKQLGEVLNIVNPENGGKYEFPIENVLKNNHTVYFEGINVLDRENGSQRLILGSVSPIVEESGKTVGTLTVFQDISDKKIAEEKIRYHEYYDGLTDLPNRKLFYEYLTAALENASKNKSKLSVLIIDLDYFKNINDTLGYHIGDILLQQISKRLAEVLNENDVLARISGDEFSVLMPQIESNVQVYDMAETILKKLGSVFYIKEHELYVTVSVGIAFHPEDGSQTDTIMGHADSALYNAKESGRNAYKSYSDIDNVKFIERISLAKDLRTAIERNEMTVYYQPKISGDTGELIGVEALVRWMHPRKGIITPGDFIPIAEETGLIMELDKWVMKTACSQLKDYCDAVNETIRLSVNLSAYQFRHHDLVDTINSIISITGFDPHLLELEITETTAMYNLDFTIKTLEKLKKMGISISIDDFGTGYSSLSYLRYFPIHILKIDRSFISDIVKDNNTRIIVKSVIDVAHSLKLKVTAEGVETAEQLSLLRKMNCDEIQGYLISKPLPLNELKLDSVCS